MQQVQNVYLQRCKIKKILGDILYGNIADRGESIICCQILVILSYKKNPALLVHYDPYGDMNRQYEFDTENWTDPPGKFKLIKFT